ncbi:unnamed protein product [Polarella glacialis]|uniref:Amine oxidase n=1 Tax=Polarella glacialis TaxID=89957 RepID=A0A813GYE9_POLGL|nr:unnamed protein product [Polarella glacialis]
MTFPGQAAYCCQRDGVVQSDVAWAIERGALQLQTVQDTAAIGEELLLELYKLLGHSRPRPMESNCAAWDYSGQYLQGSTPVDGNSGACLWDAQRMIGCCGDWMLDGRVEGAYVSGDALGRLLVAELQRTE